MIYYLKYPGKSQRLDKFEQSIKDERPKIKWYQWYQCGYFLTKLDPKQRVVLELFPGGITNRYFHLFHVIHILIVKLHITYLILIYHFRSPGYPFEINRYINQYTDCHCSTDNYIIQTIRETLGSISVWEVGKFSRKDRKAE